MSNWKSITVVLAVAAAANAWADDRTPSDHAHMSGTSASAHADPELQNLTTAKFFAKAAASGMKEVHAAELALRSANSEQVKAFARQMVSDHTKQNSQLTTLAARNNVPLPKDLAEKQKAEIEKLRAEKGATFDTVFMEQMKLDHENAVALFQSCAGSSTIAKDVRTFCRDNLPTLEEHRQAANALEKRSNTTRAASADE